MSAAPRVRAAEGGVVVELPASVPASRVLRASYVLSGSAYFRLRRSRSGGFSVWMAPKKGAGAQARVLARAWLAELEAQAFRLELAERNEGLKAQWLREALCR